LSEQRFPGRVLDLLEARHDPADLRSQRTTLKGLVAIISDEIDAFQMGCGFCEQA
jgi:hypothetical protein